MSAYTRAEETAVQAVAGSIVWAFRRLKKPRCREMSARGYALDSVCPQLSFFSSTPNDSFMCVIVIFSREFRKSHLQFTRRMAMVVVEYGSVYV